MERAQLYIELAESSLEVGHIEFARRHIHEAIRSVDGELEGEIGQCIREILERLD